MADIGYARVSTRDQNPQLQLDALEEAGCWPIYEEKVSGVAKRRPVRDEVLARLDRGDALVVWKLDRLGRSAVELLTIVRDLDQRGIRFRCLTQPIDTSTHMGKFFIALLAAFAEFERELMRERVIAGKARMLADGEHPGGPPMFGFEADHVTIVEEQAALLRDAARRLLAGEPAGRIVEDLNGRGERPRRADHWQVTALRRALRNPRVVPILGQVTYDRLARLFGAPDRQRLGAPATHLLSGILVCGRCSQPMYGALRSDKGKPTRLIYRCKKGAGSGGRFAGCGSTVVSLARADAWALEAFIAAVASDELAAALNQRQAELLAGEVTAAQLDDARAEIAELDQVLGTRFAVDSHRRRHAELRRMVEAATAQLMRQPELQALYDLPKSEAALRAAWGAWSTAERRAWLRRVLNHVTVTPATRRDRGSDVAGRLHPDWRV